MIRLTRSVGWAAAVMAACAGPVRAQDQLVPGKRLTLKSIAASERTKFVAKLVRGFLGVPLRASTDDPTLFGASLQILNPTTAESFTFDLPPNCWLANKSGSYHS